MNTQNPTRQSGNGTPWEDLSRAAQDVHAEWEEAWQGLAGDIRAQGREPRCQPGCIPCCYTRKTCTLSEGVAILDYLQKNHTPEMQEQFRLRVESAAGSLRRLREDGYCDSEDRFFRAGGMECPFLEAGRCVIYEARPLSCRALNVMTDTSVEKCRQCPQAVNCIESENLHQKLQKKLDDREKKLQAPVLPAGLRPTLIPEVLSYLWEEQSTPSVLYSPAALQQKLATRGTERDETWQDDRGDFRAVRMNITLPEEGDYSHDLTLLKQQFQNHELYGQPVSGKGIPEFCTLYKRNENCRFDWGTRKFTGWEEGKDDLPYTVWMSDGLQERLMMWEAAKRCRGRVLCGGLGLGIFPQMALSLPRVDAVDVVERDPEVIALISNAWKKQPWPRRSDCRLLPSPIEEFLETTKEKYDTVYIDTWDAIYNEYLPHLNELTRLAKPILRPGGEVLLWAFDMMVRDFLQTVTLVVERRQKYAVMNKGQMKNLKLRYPLLHRLVTWLWKHPESSDEELRSEGYRLATKESRNLGMLVLSRQAGTQVLLDQKYSAGSPFLQ